MDESRKIQQPGQQARAGGGQKSFSILNPATGEEVGNYPLMDGTEVDNCIRRARQAFPWWSKSDFSFRREIFNRAASHLAENARYYAAIIASETGKTEVDAILAEIFPTCDLLHYYGKNAERFLQPVKADTSLLLPGRKAYYSFEPRGVVGVIAPWNYPFSLAAGPVISALAAGNAVVLKPSSETTASGKIIAEIFKAAELPDNVLQVLTGSGSVTGQALIEHKDLDMLFFTGSTEVGLNVGQAAARNIVPAVMELGGKDAMVVTRHADLERAVHAAVWGAFFNSGQTCIGVEFCFVEESIYEQFLEKAVALTQSLASGTVSGQIGAMTTEGQVKIVETQLSDALSKGASVHAGGARRKDGKGRFFAPTIITGITPQMKIWQEETFGPILPIVSFGTQEEAIQMVNSTPYGLSGSVFSQDMEEARSYASRMETGSVNINDCLVTYVFPSLPFGGAKTSGVNYYHGEIGIRNFCRIKSMTEFSGLYTREFFYYPLDAKAKEGIEAVLIFLFSQNRMAKLKALPKAGNIIGDLIRGVVNKKMTRYSDSRKLR